MRTLLQSGASARRGEHGLLSPLSGGRTALPLCLHFGAASRRGEPRLAFGYSAPPPMSLLPREAGGEPRRAFRCPQGPGKGCGKLGMMARRRVCRWIHIRGIRDNKASARDRRVPFTAKCTMHLLLRLRPPAFRQPPPVCTPALTDFSRQPSAFGLTPDTPRPGTRGTPRPSSRSRGNTARSTRPSAPASSLPSPATSRSGTRPGGTSPVPSGSFGPRS